MLAFHLPTTVDKEPNISNLSEAPAVLSFFAQDFMTNSLEPIYVTGVDIVICIIFMFLFATVMTFSSAEE